MGNPSMMLVTLHWIINVLELHLSKKTFTAGQRLSGVVIFRAAKNIDIRAIYVGINGYEQPSIFQDKKPSLFFNREVLITGKDKPRFFSDRISMLWNAFLARDPGRTLTKGEHIYPFTILLPASVPSTYEGKAGKIEYSLYAKVVYPVLGDETVNQKVDIFSPPRVQRGMRMALTYRGPGSIVYNTDIRVSLDLEQRAIKVGDKIKGRIKLDNPSNHYVRKIELTLELCEWVKSPKSKGIDRELICSETINTKHPSAPAIEAEFELQVPSDSIPTVDCTMISVLWLLKINLDTVPPMEYKTPVTVYSEE